MKAYVSAAALFFKHFGNKRTGMCATYVDDTLHRADYKNSDIFHGTKELLSCKSIECEIAEFYGLHIELENELRIIHQTTYMSKLTKRDKNYFYNTSNLCGPRWRGVLILGLIFSVTWH